MSYTITSWQNCYDDGWKGLITDAAFSHPAKFSHGLIKRIYQHALAMGYIQPGGVVLDPFGGVGLGGWAAASCRLSWIGVELEDRFSTLARHNFIEWAERYWCTCGENGNSYLRSMRESVAKDRVGNEPAKETQDRAVLQPGMPQQISLFGEEAFAGASRGTKGTQALEQGASLESGDATNAIGEGSGGQQGNGEKRELEGGQGDTRGRVYQYTGERQAEVGTSALDGIELGPEVGGIRIRSSQEWEQAGQPLGEFGTNDQINPHETSSPGWDKAESEREAMRDLREDISEHQRDDCLRAAMQAAADSRVLATARRQTEGATCQNCGKLIVPFPVILQGDSRHLASVIAGAGVVVGSPPYASGEKGHPSLGSVNKDDWGKDGRDIAGRRGLNGNYGSSSGQLAEMQEGQISAIIGSPPFAGNTGGRGEASRNGIDAALFDRHSGGMKRGTGSDPANLDHLPQGEAPALIVGSPPYTGQEVPDWAKKGSLANNKDYDRSRPSEARAYGSTDGQLGAMVVGSPPFAGSVGSDDPAKRGGILASDPKRAGDVNLTGSYGDAPGQLGAMVVGSPPYEGMMSQTGGGIYGEKDNTDLAKNVRNKEMNYGSSSNNIGNATPDTFWAAAAVILNQCYQVLPVGGYAIWVTKRYVKNGKIVDFSGQWAALCEASGFEVVEWIRAWLIKNQGLAQVGIDGELVSKEVGRKSFFRRLHERKNPHLSIDWEDVIVVRKCPTPGGDAEAA